jgi:mRNA-degrading endonuclease RelE of RelBE toxin-antitoxin system
MSYRLLIANEVLEFLDGLRHRERLLLRARFVQIADFPENFSDFQERDATGRALEVNLCGKYAITYWTDFADRDVKILRISNADR